MLLSKHENKVIACPVLQLPTRRKSGESSHSNTDTLSQNY